MYNVYHRQEMAKFKNMRRTPDNAVDIRPSVDTFAALSRKNAKRSEAELVGAVAPRNTEEQLWIRNARYAISHDIDPVMFVRMQFFGLEPGVPPCAPAQLASSLALRRYRAGLKAATQEIGDSLQIQNSAFSTACIRVGAMLQQQPPRTETVWQLVLRDLKVQVSAIFRYCVAVSVAGAPKTQDKAAFSHIADMFLTPAAVQYALAPTIYDETWKQLLPPGFSELAGRVYGQMTDGNTFDSMIDDKAVPRG